MKKDIETWDQAQCQALIAQLWRVREAMIEFEGRLEPALQNVDHECMASARNLAHYLALRQHDRRSLQQALARLGLSSLGRSESHVLANLDKVLGILHRLANLPWQPKSDDEPVGIRSSQRRANKHADDLLGLAPPDRGVRIMVTLPSEASENYGLVRRLVQSGMDIARINCSHDSKLQWRNMAANVKRAARAERRPVRILMDLGGPKLRTCGIPPGPAVVKVRPERDAFGRVIRPARVGLRAMDSIGQFPDVSAHVGVDAEWLEALKIGDSITLVDARGSNRRFDVVHHDPQGVIVESDQTCYLVPETIFKRPGKVKGNSSPAHGIEPGEGILQVVRGSVLRLVRLQAWSDSVALPRKGRKSIPLIGCTLPEVFSQVCVGERIWFDDGRIGGVIRQVESDWLDVEITHARDGGEKLASDKGINLPDSQLHLPALTEKDIEDLATVAKEADMVGLSFVQQAADVDTLREVLQSLGASEIGIVLKIETRRAFENLPAILFSAMQSRKAGVMIARGDLAVECGYERLAEVQEEILWAAEAAHMPVIWATQVLETLAKTGLPSRAEITDAAMGERAECVMLNKGPHITEAIRTLDDILRRMQAHQSKKRPLLRALRAWSMPETQL
jgi:pyruvate kinase